ncbi:MAG: arginase family protein [Bacteriovoracaceae bacterium]
MNLTHLENRSQERLESLLKESNSTEKVLAHFFLHESDVGVMRNGGRNGARFAPRAVINVLKKMAWHGPWNQPVKLHFFENSEAEKKNFLETQEQSYEVLSKLIKGNSRKIQIGGGHDHIYPFLKAIATKHKKIVCLNIDAHCDTRTDHEKHSGTPFRQFAGLEICEFHLIQIGIHSFANSDSTLSNVPGAMVTTYEAPLEENIFKTIEQILKTLEVGTAVVFSLDMDALESSVMEGVSAVNHQGLNLFEVNGLLDLVLKEKELVPYFGFYEYNPLYDNLSQKGARLMASLIYKILVK